MEIMEKESADALRYWATTGRTGADSPLNLENIATGRRLVTKLWNASRFAESRLAHFTNGVRPAVLLPTDRWLLSRLARTIAGATAELDRYEYAAARAEIDRFFWSDLCDNYLEMAKARLYNEAGAAHYAAQWTLYQALLAVLKLLAPFLPYITEEIYQGLVVAGQGDDRAVVVVVVPQHVEAVAALIRGPHETRMLRLEHDRFAIAFDCGMSIAQVDQDISEADVDFSVVVGDRNGLLERF